MQSPKLKQIVKNVANTLSPMNPNGKQKMPPPTIQVESYPPKGNKPGACRMVFDRPVVTFAMDPHVARDIAAAIVRSSFLAEGLNEDGTPKIIVPESKIVVPG